MSDYFSGGKNRALAGAAAPAAPFPRLEQDNCNRNRSRKGHYLAEVNILGYIRHHGEKNVAELVVTVGIVCHQRNSNRNGIRFLRVSFVSDLFGYVDENGKLVAAIGTRTVL